jgi:cytochrome P450
MSSQVRVDARLVNAARLGDPSFYAGDPHPTFARLRAEAPVFWYEASQFWAVTKYADVRMVGSNPSLFSSLNGTLVAEGLTRRDPEYFSNLIRTGPKHLLRSDAPEHSSLRRLVSRSFTPRAVSALEPRIRRIAGNVLDAVENEATVNLVETLSAPVTTFAIGELMGVPEDQWQEFWRWTDASIMQIDVDDADEPEVSKSISELLEFFHELLARRRNEPSDDIVSYLVDRSDDNLQLSEADLVTFCKFLLVAGSETTRNLVTGGVHLLALNPDQRELLLRRPDLMPSAIEEMLRLVSPVSAFGRTAMRQTEIRGKMIQEGDFVVMLYPSANRDEEVWADPNKFDVARSMDVPNLAFGFGPHVCLGASLARLEARVIFEELLARYPEFEVQGDPVRRGSTLVSVVTELPVIYGPRS